MPTRFPFLDAGGPIAFAHRGAAPPGLENTLAAVDRVVGLGFGYLETEDFEMALGKEDERERSGEENDVLDVAATRRAECAE